MKKLFALVALVGMGAFLGGCAEETKTAPAKTPAGGTTGPGAIHSGPKADPDKGKTDGDKDMDKDGDKDADKGDADKGDADKGDADDKPKEE
jgi:hypothetical protein